MKLLSKVLPEQIVKEQKMTAFKTNINTRLVLEIISTNIPVSENMMNLYLKI